MNTYVHVSRVNKNPNLQKINDKTTQHREKLHDNDNNPASYFYGMGNNY